MEAPNASEPSSPSKGSILSERSSPSTLAIFQVQQIRPVQFRPVAALLLFALLFAISGCASAQPTPQAAPTSPSPKLSPAEVVSAQLAALKNNDADDMGIRITFRFASPGNQAQTGPVDRFIAMLKNPAYRPMINYQSDHREPIEVDGNVAKQIVTLVSSGEHPLGDTAVKKMRERGKQVPDSHRALVPQRARHDLLRQSEERVVHPLVDSALMLKPDSRIQQVVAAVKGLIMAEV